MYATIGKIGQNSMQITENMYYTLKIISIHSHVDIDIYIIKIVNQFFEILPEARIVFETPSCVRYVDTICIAAEIPGIQ